MHATLALSYYVLNKRYFLFLGKAMLMDKTLQNAGLPTCKVIVLQVQK